MKALIIAAHGSRKATSNREVAALVEKVAAKAGNQVDLVSHAFLQFADPSLETAIVEAAGNGAREVIIFPFFISAGSHVTTDIPELVTDAESRYPDIRFSITRHLGIIESVEDIILGEIAG